MHNSITAHTVLASGTAPKDQSLNVVFGSFNNFSSSVHFHPQVCMAPYDKRIIFLPHNSWVLFACSQAPFVHWFSLSCYVSNTSKVTTFRGVLLCITVFQTMLMSMSHRTRGRLFYSRRRLCYF